MNGKAWQERPSCLGVNELGFQETPSCRVIQKYIYLYKTNEAIVSYWNSGEKMEKTKGWRDAILSAAEVEEKRV